MERPSRRRILGDRNLQIVIAVLILGVCGGSLVGPMLPAMLEPLHVSEEKVGLVLSVYTFWALISTPLLGILADKLGRKTILVPCTLCFGLGGLGIAMSRSFELVLLFRSLQGVCVGGMMNTGVTLIGDFFTGEDRARAMGYRISFQTITNSIIPFVSGALATLAWFYPFFIYSVGIPLGLIAAARLQWAPGNNQDPKPQRREYLVQVLRIVLHHRALWIFFCNFMGFVLLFALVVYMPILVVREFEQTTMHAGLAITFAAGTAALISSQTGRFMSLFSEYWLVLVGFGLCGSALVLLTLPESFGMLLLCFVLWGSGFGLLMPTLNTCATGLATSHFRAGVVSVFTTMIYLGQTVSPPLFGFILGRSDLDTVFYLAGSLALLPICFTLAEYAVHKGRKQVDSHS